MTWYMALAAGFTDGEECGKAGEGQREDEDGDTDNMAYLARLVLQMLLAELKEYGFLHASGKEKSTCYQVIAGSSMTLSMT